MWLWQISAMPSYSINPAEWLSPLRRWLLMRPISRRLIFVLMIGHPRNFTDNRDAREEDSVLGRETNGSRRFDGIPPIEVPCHSLYTFVILTSFLLKTKSWSNRMLWRLCVSGHSLREDVNRKKRFLSGIARMRGGGLPMPEFFGPLFLPSNSP